MADGIEFERVALLALDSDCMSTPFIGCSITGGYRHGARVSVHMYVYLHIHIHKYVYVIDSIKWLDSERRCCRCCWRFTLPLRCHFKRVIDLTVDWVSWQLALWQLLLMGMSRYRVKRRIMLLLLLFLLLLVTGAVLGFFQLWSCLFWGVLYSKLQCFFGLGFEDFCWLCMFHNNSSDRVPSKWRTDRQIEQASEWPLFVPSVRPSFWWHTFTSLEGICIH